jgi:hypothetical protein
MGNVSSSVCGVPWLLLYFEKAKPVWPFGLSKFKQESKIQSELRHIFLPQKTSTGIR